MARSSDGVEFYRICFTLRYRQDRNCFFGGGIRLEKGRGNFENGYLVSLRTASIESIFLLISVVIMIVVEGIIRAVKHQLSLITGTGRQYE